MSETDPQDPPTTEEKPSRSSRKAPRPIDATNARLEGVEAVADWARQTALAAALLALCCLLAVAVVVWKLRPAAGAALGASAAPLVPAMP
jgi:hypothetical protein